MNIKTGILLIIPSLFFLISCNKDTVVTKTTSAEKNVAIQEDQIYQIKQPAKSNISRGLIVRNIDNPLNIQEIEIGLMDFSSKYFPTDKYYLQEGQYLNEELINKWLERKSKDEPDGLNPSKNNNGLLKSERESPKILSHVLEQNFINKKGKLAGISLAISLNEYYHFSVMDNKGATYTDEVKVDNDNNKINDVETYGKKITRNIINDIRSNKDIPRVPIFITLYQESKQNSIIPGRFLAETYLSEDEVKIPKWNSINRKYYSFPSDELYKKDRISSDILSDLKTDIQKYFVSLNPTVTGSLLYKKDELAKMNINVNTPVISDTELIALSQFITSEINIISPKVDTTINIVNHKKEKVGFITWNPVAKKIYTNL
ncbi:CamS family sex pheromone protein [Rummeliibacillus stabekisii]|uniref:CamS family sex pheromone protein n=1 Tax=Rummeliibacillus stabekisii TaxID=241244 RepID=UPI0037114091